MWPPGTTYAWPTAATALEVLSASANDAAAGSGATEVTIEGLLAGFVQASETVTLNGTTPVATANQYLRVNRVYVSDGNAKTGNVGAITVRVTGGGNTLAHISAGQGETQQAIYTVPAGHELVVMSMSAFVEDSQPGSIRLWQDPGQNVARLVDQFVKVERFVESKYDSGIRFAAGTDLWVTIAPGSTDTYASAHLNGWLGRI